MKPQETQLQNSQQNTLLSPDRQRMAEDEQEHAGKWAVLGIVAIGVFMATLDSSIVNISLPPIALYFNVPLSGPVEWVVIAYLVATAAVLLTAGRLADMVGRKAVWAVGLVVFTGGSAICGAAPSLGLLIAARALQGLGGALMMAVSPAMLTTAFPASERGKALGLNAVIVALGVSVGPTLGGLITGYLSWRWIFFVNVPIGIIGLFLTLRILTEKLRRNPGRFDPLGAFMLALGLAGLTAGLSFGQELGWTSPLLLSSLIIGCLALASLPFIESRVVNPIIHFSLLHNRVFVSAILSLVLSFLALFAVSFMLPFYLEQLRHFPTEKAGLLLTPLPLTIALIAPFSGTLADRIGTRWLAASGLAIACLGLVLIGQLNAQSSIFDIIWRLVVTGVGQALFQSPNNSALLGAAPRNEQGSASGFLATGRTMGQSVSVALAGAIFAGFGGAEAGRLLSLQLDRAHVAALQQTFAHSFQMTFTVCAVIAAVGVFASLVRGKEERSRKRGQSVASR
ncbi:DHA2 family efflux MFS transporter permease subunit [Ktedonosporobacter rubrisoli]|uniref:DHA2 family efflux MFS transporter permease subunit n=1 Tax=Ktedonosporobacter rubrisoli TaxID=2509675 RepID=A0A4P6JXU5_KTERU|nr:MFS transporter [Ktedonosporobacter rubrisoli]QBD80272.1 DHA2 family efflux MFS transporter permease subunit [Ktedonosporobacter rubrisoli]